MKLWSFQHFPTGGSPCSSTACGISHLLNCIGANLLILEASVLDILMSATPQKRTSCAFVLTGQNADGSNRVKLKSARTCELSVGACFICSLLGVVELHYHWTFRRCSEGIGCVALAGVWMDGMQGDSRSSCFLPLSKDMHLGISHQ